MEFQEIAPPNVMIVNKKSLVDLHYDVVLWTDRQPWLADRSKVCASQVSSLTQTFTHSFIEHIPFHMTHTRFRVGR